MKNRLPHAPCPVPLRLGLVLGLVLAGLAGGVWMAGWRGLWPEVTAAAFGTTAGLLAGAMLLAVTGALAAGAVLSRLGFAGRWLGLLAGKALAFFPVNALAWAFIGAWVGRGWPVWSLMLVKPPAEDLTAQARVAQMVWTWAPPLFLLALPLAGQMLTVVLDALKEAGPRPLQTGLRARGLKPAAQFYQHRLPQAWKGVRGRLWLTGLLGLVLLPVIEEAFGIAGMAAPLAAALRAYDLPALGTHWLLLCLAGALWCGLIWRRRPVRVPWERAVLEGAVAIGYPPGRAWRLHVLPVELRRVCARLLRGCAWLVAGITLYTSVTGLWPGSLLAASSAEAFMDPAAPVRAGLAPMLCALSLWLLGRMIAPRSLTLSCSVSRSRHV